MKFYILSDHHGLVGYYATKELAIEAAENAYESDLELSFECADQTFQDYWDGRCDLEEVELEMGDNDVYQFCSPDPVETKEDKE